MISIIFSFRNEEDVIPKLIERVLAVLGPLKTEYEMVFVNDSSSDGSLEVLKGFHAGNKNIKIINMSRRFGVGPCLMAGLRNSKGDAAIYMDADLQDPPEVIPSLLAKWREGADVVHTIRTAREGERASKIWLANIAYRVINLFAGLKIPEDAGDFKLLSRRAIDAITRVNEDDPYMRGLAVWVGFKQDKVYYKRAPRLAGRGHFPLIKSIGPAEMFVRGLTSFSETPLYLSLLSGILVMTAVFVYFAWAALTALIGASGFDRPGLTAAAIFFLSGVILCAIGVQGLYIGRIYRELKQRPGYIIESTIGIE
ncbi:MAG: glycosyltransferase family 2 protein [Candidatus Omnitrophota bacterium]